MEHVAVVCMHVLQGSFSWVVSIANCMGTTVDDVQNFVHGERLLRPAAILLLVYPVFRNSRVLGPPVGGSECTVRRCGSRV